MVFRVGPAKYAENLGKIVALARRRGARVVLLTRPYIGKSSNPTWWKNFAPRYVEVTLEVGRRLNVPVVDVHSHFSKRPGLFADESHFNAAGHRAAAELILGTVLQVTR